MRFEVLGTPRAVDASGSRVPAGGRQHQVVLACLLAADGRTVTDGTLMETLWGHGPSNSKRVALRVLVHHLRRNLGTESIVRANGGYRMMLDGHQLDASEFVALVESAAHDEARGRLAEARRSYRKALRLWRAPEAYQGTADTELVRAAAEHLGEQRMIAFESCVDIELSFGLHRELCAELAALATENPLRERLQAQLMLALVRSDRRAEALTTYERTRRLLADELGADPGARLQQLHTAILRGPAQAGTPSAVSDAVRPMQLPAPPSIFVAREDELSILDSLHKKVGPGQRLCGAMVVTGAGGMGKTALVTHWARQHQRGFPGGQLYLDLDDGTPAAALARSLIDLGVAPDDVPQQAEARAAKLRTLLSSRTVLMVLDNVGTAEQARPFLPGSGDSLLVIVSRNRLDGLVAREGLHLLVLTPLPVEPATRLLSETAGMSEPAIGDVRTLVELCHGMPLALRIVGAHLRLGAQPGILVADLKDERTRIARLTTTDGDVSVHAVIALSYRRLATPDRQLLRRLGLSGAGAIPLGAAAALAGVTSGTVLIGLIGRLTAVNLVALEAGRISLHQLTRIFAREQGQLEDTSADRANAERRLLSWYGQATGEAQQRIRPTAGGPDGKGAPDPLHLFLPELPDTAAAVRWVDAESDTIIKMITEHAQGHPDLVWPLAAHMRGWLQRRANRDTWITVTERGIRAAAMAGSSTGEATLQGSLGVAHSLLLHRVEARAAYQRASALCQRNGDHAGLADVEASLGGMLVESGELDEALPPLLRARHSANLLNDPDLIFKVEHNLGLLHRRAGRQQEALDSYTSALAAADRSGNRDWLSASVHTNLGRLHFLRDNVDLAETHYDTAVRLARSTGDRMREAWALHGCSDVAAARRDVPAAVAAMQKAVTILETLGDRRLDEMRARLAELLSDGTAGQTTPDQ
ncbi:BTAD domain-containing putative transcriptional regulator [Micromonospora sp. CA-259024]|uniref:AfsR/SARP family transcriptional regulator n=1 Tax=Micromonospora sp. CA-259024 TaxID=3239965 RepID=UPI003D8CA672